MGLRGPAKKPTALEQAEGRPGHRPLPTDEVVFPEGSPAMPRGMSKAARVIWKETVATMQMVPGLLTVADSSVLADYCEVRAEVDQMLRAQRQATERAIAQAVAEGRAATPDEIKAAIIDKYTGTMSKLRHRLNVLRRELGLTPSSRSSLRVTGQIIGQPNKPAPLDTALFGGAGSGPRLVKTSQE